MLLLRQGGRASCGAVAALPEGNGQIIAATYRRYLPTEAGLAAELERERTAAERVLRLTAPSADEGFGSEPRRVPEATVAQKAEAGRDQPG